LTLGPITIFFGAVLIALGLVGYFATGMVSITALIPTFFGLVLAVLGLLALKDSLRKHAMHLAAVVGLVGFLGAGAMAGPKLPALLANQPILRDGKDARGAALCQAIMAVICVLFLALCINSFIQARRRRRLAAGEPTNPA
jgi:hypothetical protein